MLVTISTTHPRANDFLSLIWHWNIQWHLHKRETTFVKRFGMHSLEVVGFAAAMLIIPLTMHRAIRGFDEMYETLGRRAESPYAHSSWVNIAFAFIILVGWHLWLGRLAYLTVLESGTDEENDDGKEDKSKASSSSTEKRDVSSGKEAISWGRLLGRILIPFLLVALGLHFGYQICRRLTTDAKPFITKNDVDMQEAMGQLYGLT